jgi:LysR family transcriptional regulator, salicylic acid-responsive activator of bsdBCD
MDIKRLRYFCSLIEHGSVSGAARALDVAQPAISRRLQELEDEIGAILFTRGVRHIEPTRAGAHLYKCAREILRGVENVATEVITEVKPISERSAKTIRVGISPLYTQFFQPLIMELNQKLPDINFSICVSDSSYLESLLVANSLDVALIQKPLFPRDYDCINLRPVRGVAVINQKYTKDIPDRPMTLPQLGRFPLFLIRRSEGEGTFELIQHKLRKIGITPYVQMSASQPNVILSWIDSGLFGISLMPDSEVNSDRWKNCKTYELDSASDVFCPSVVKMKSSSYAAELMEVLGRMDWYRGISLH